VCYAHHPGKKFPFFAIGTFFKGFDHLDKGILKDILGDIPVKYFGINKTGEALVVFVDQYFESLFVSANVISHQYRILEL
jgi:hypothetical protein